MILKLNARNQITIPRDIRGKLNIKAGDHLLVDAQDGMMVVIPKPKLYTDYLQGLHRDIWKSIDAQDYIANEREAWISSANW